MANRPRPTRPPPIPKPGQVKVVRAVYKYDAKQPDELSFEEGDTLFILDKSDSGWWRAKCGTKVGLIPSNYVEEKTENVDHPLHDAAKRGNTSFLQECISNRVSVNGLDKAGATPLHWASNGGHLDCLEKLLSVPNCTINVQNKLGDTPLHAAAWKGHAEAVRMLLEKGADPSMRNNAEKLPSDLTKDPDCAALLREAMGTRASRYSDDYGGDEDDSD